MRQKFLRAMSLVLVLVLAVSMLSLSAGARGRSFKVTVYEVVGDGTVTVSNTTAYPKDTVYITATPDSGNLLTYLRVSDSRGNRISLSYVWKNVYSFTMPASYVTIQSVFVPTWLAVIGALDILTSDDTSNDFPFTDVALGTWYYEAVEFVYDYGYMDGVSATRFDPDGALSRGMLAKVLYNVEEEQRDFPTEFSDVPNSAWYADAVNWAAANNIVKGYGKDKFGPEDLVTREQMAAILYRYAELKGYDMSARADLSGYKDADKISSWAKDAMSWAVGNYLISGKGGKTLDPTGTATRAEVAQIVMWFCGNVL